jgi:hypothetical protein
VVHHVVLAMVACSHELQRQGLTLFCDAWTQGSSVPNLESGLQRDANQAGKQWADPSRCRPERADSVIAYLKR